jgi:hypothetical protein
LELIHAGLMVIQPGQDEMPGIAYYYLGTQDAHLCC